MPDVTPIVLQQIDLDIVPGKIPPIVHVSEYDTGRQILVNLFRDGYPFGSNSIESYDVKVEGSIGKYGFSEDASWAADADGVVSINLTEAMTAIHGRVWTKVKLISDGKQISTCGFWLDVDRAGVEAETVIGAPGFEEKIRNATEDWLEEQGFSSPTIDVTEITGGHRVTVTDYQGSESFDVIDGVLVATIIDGDTLYVDNMEVVENYDEEEF